MGVSNWFKSRKFVVAVIGTVVNAFVLVLALMKMDWSMEVEAILKRMTSILIFANSPLVPLYAWAFGEFIRDWVASFGMNRASVEGAQGIQRLAVAARIDAEAMKMAEMADRTGNAKSAPTVKVNVVPKPEAEPTEKSEG